MDKALDDGRTAADLTARKAAYAKVQQLIRTDIPYIWGSFSTVYVISNKKLTGVDPSGFFPAKTVGLAA